MSVVQTTGIARERSARGVAVALPGDAVVRARVLSVVAGTVDGHVRSVDVATRVGGQGRRLVQMTLVVHRVPEP